MWGFESLYLDLGLWLKLGECFPSRPLLSFQELVRDCGLTGTLFCLLLSLQSSGPWLLYRKEKSAFWLGVSTLPGVVIRPRNLMLSLYPCP